MSIRNRGPARAWSGEDEMLLLRLASRNASQADMAKFLGRSISSIEGKLRLLREGRSRPIHGANAYGRPDHVAADDEAHVRAALMAGGFRWLRPDIAKRFYALENSPPRKIEFWRAA